MISIQACKDVGEIILSRPWSKCKGPGTVWLEGSDRARVRVIDDEVRVESVGEMMKNLVGYAKEFGFGCKSNGNAVESFKQKSGMT